MSDVHNAPCHGCGERTADCHGTCEKYLTWYAERQEWLAKVNHAKEMERAMTQHIYKRNSRVRRIRHLRRRSEQ